MNENERSVLVDEKIALMSNDAKHLHELIKQREILINENVLKLKTEKKNQMSTLDKIREEHSQIRCAKNDAKEQDRQKLSRTLMANLVTAADYPNCPPYVHHIINFLKNILGNVFCVFFLNLVFSFYIFLRGDYFNSRNM